MNGCTHRSTVWKFPIEGRGISSVSMPLGAEILCAMPQSGGAYLWARVDPQAELVPVRVGMFFTGHDAGDGLPHHVGSFMTDGGVYVFHVFTESRIVGQDRRRDDDA